MIGAAGAGPWVAAARALGGDAVARAAVDTGGFRFGKVLNLRDVNFLPGGAKYHDLPGILALNAPGALYLAGEGERAPAVLERVYRAAGAGERLTCYSGVADGFAEAAAAWLLHVD
jgi:hypothetical protein